MDYFNHQGKQPQKVKDILSKYENEDNNYLNCQNLQNELNGIGWTIEYGLDAEPYNLKPLK